MITKKQAEELFEILIVNAVYDKNTISFRNLYDRFPNLADNFANGMGKNLKDLDFPECTDAGMQQKYEELMDRISHSDMRK